MCVYWDECDRYEANGACSGISGLKEEPDCFKTDPLKAQTKPVANVLCSDRVIKPCPFCGGPGKTYTWAVKEHLVFCGSEDCETRPQTKVKINDREAIEAWNKRAL